VVKRTSDDLGGAADGVGVDVLLALLDLGHGRGGGFGREENPRRGEMGSELGRKERD
jgi:hypothetical protein